MKKLLVLLFLTGYLYVTYATINHYQKDNLLLEGIPDIPLNNIIQDLAPYQNVRSAVFCDWLPANKGMIIRTRFGNVSQLHLITQPAGYRKQLTFFDESIRQAVVCPNAAGNCLLFLKDSAGNELYQIYALDYQTGKYEMITDGRFRNQGIIWSNKGNRFAFASTKRNGKDYDIYLSYLHDRKNHKILLKNTGLWLPVEFSPDDRQLLVKHYVSATESYLYILDLTTKKLTQINPVKDKIALGHACWAYDGNGIYYLSDQYGDFKQLVYYDLIKKTNIPLTKNIPHDIIDFDINSMNKTIALVSNEEKKSTLYFLNTSTNKITQATLPAGWFYNIKFKPEGDELALVINQTKAPSDVYTLNLQTKTFLRWTYSEIGSIDTSSFVLPELIHFPTFDSLGDKPRSISAFYYKPATTQPPYPVMIICHGGPAGQYRPGFSPLTQYFVNELGIAVIAPNVRGSSGYGKTYLKLDDGYKREDAVKDIGALLQWIKMQPELNERRIAITGGSYGGYLVLSVMTHYNNQIACGIDVCGISDFITFLKNTGKYRQDLRRAEYGDERESAIYNFLKKISPLTNASMIKKPLFIIQGLNDPRVPVTQAEQIKKAVSKNNVEVWYLQANDEGHGFRKKKNRNLADWLKVLFLEKYLLGKKY